jgi:2,3,4,5-tetrahydropyridine-2-carboxylate N-succinyltransferase
MTNTIEERLATIGPKTDRMEAVRTIGLFLSELEAGSVRAAIRDEDGVWHAQTWVKQGILLAFRVGVAAEFASGTLSFIDKDTIPTRRFRAQDGIRIVPGGSAIRRGTFIAKGVVMMPPAYVNVGAYVDEDTMIDSHALVGSCAQIGKRVHLSAAAQIGGVLEPVGELPVIVEDDVLIGGNCGIYEGAIVRERAVLASGVILTGGTPVYDLPRGLEYRKSPGHPLEIPAGAVVVPGARTLREGKGKEWGISLQTPVIVKYRDAKTDASAALEDLLR